MRPTENISQTSPAIPTAQPLGVQLVAEWNRIKEKDGIKAANTWSANLDQAVWEVLMEAKRTGLKA